MEKLPLIDNWSGFANLLANLIEKYAAVLDIENLPEPPILQMLLEIPKQHDIINV